MWLGGARHAAHAPATRTARPGWRISGEPRHCPTPGIMTGVCGTLEEEVWSDVHASRWHSTTPTVITSYYHHPPTTIRDHVDDQDSTPGLPTACLGTIQVTCLYCLTLVSEKEKKNSFTLTFSFTGLRCVFTEGVYYCCCCRWRRSLFLQDTEGGGEGYKCLVYIEATRD